MRRNNTALRFFINHSAAEGSSRTTIPFSTHSLPFISNRNRYVPTWMVRILTRITHCGGALNRFGFFGRFRSCSGTRKRWRFRSHHSRLEYRLLAA